MSKTQALKNVITLNMNQELLIFIKKIAKKDNVSVVTACRRLLKKSIENEEDIYFSKTGDERLTKNFRRIKHKDL